MTGYLGTRWPSWLTRPCGTEAAYRRHYRRGEKPCAACREANRRASQARYEARKRMEGAA